MSRLSQLLLLVVVAMVTGKTVVWNSDNFMVLTKPTDCYPIITLPNYGLEVLKEFKNVDIRLSDNDGVEYDIVQVREGRVKGHLSYNTDATGSFFRKKVISYLGSTRIIDSICTYDENANGDTTSWEKRFITRFKYDKSNRLEYYDAANMRYTFHYNKNGNVEEMVQYGIMGSKLDKQVKKAYKYNQNGNLLQEITYMYIKGVWNKFIEKQYKYNKSYQRVSLVTSSKYGDDSVHYSYNSFGSISLEEGFRQGKLGKVWVSSSKVEYSYDKFQRPSKIRSTSKYGPNKNIEWKETLTPIETNSFKVSMSSKVECSLLNNQLTLASNSNIKYNSIVLYNILGKILFKKNLGNLEEKRFTLNIPQNMLSNGVVYYKLKTDHGLLSGKTIEIK